MQERRRRLRAYRKSRRKFSCTVYGITLAWLVLALSQWLAVCLLKDFRDNVNKYYWISLIFFISAMLLFTMFIFIKRLRFVLCLNWLLSLLIVEFLIIGLFALSAQTHWKNLIAWFLICALLTYLFILIGSILPQDLTLNVVILFVVAFLILSITVFMSMIHKIMNMSYSFYAYMVCIGLIVLMFVMYHAQTINGGRFAEMRIRDYLLASLILFNDFIIIYMLTIYPQVINNKKSTPSNTTDSYNSKESGYEDSTTTTEEVVVNWG
ncbi:uncharacterized protein LOC117185964 [Drosophila miranda]|uniref:uncharacterized protein LOC117185964 n=1 Tax=Drosophila miranda TaxID=7229 RepID=UPI00143F523C|nr:uncharacterized protein LOC117185964 [Drosophila miranda]